MTDYVLCRSATYCECGELAAWLVDSWWRDHGESVWEHCWSCDACLPMRELAAYTVDTEAVAVLPVRYVIDGVVWPPTLGLTGLTGGGTAA
jgi:hypothetical protein